MCSEYSKYELTKTIVEGQRYSFCHSFQMLKRYAMDIAIWIKLNKRWSLIEFWYTCVKVHYLCILGSDPSVHIHTLVWLYINIFYCSKCCRKTTLTDFWVVLLWTAKFRHKELLPVHSWTWINITFKIMFSCIEFIFNFKKS